MAEKKITELVSITAVSGGAILPIVAGDTTYKVGVEQLSGYTQQLIRANITGSNTFTATQNFDGAVFLNGDVTFGGNITATPITALNSYTASVDTNLFTKTLVSSSNQIASDISGSSTNLSSSVSVRLTSLEASAGTTDGLVSSSQQILNYGIFVTTSSLNVFTSSIQSEVGDIQSYTSSLKAVSIVSSSTQISNYYRFAETGSENAFYGNQTITGSLGVESIFLNSSSIYLNSNEILYRNSMGGQTYTYLKSYDDYGLALAVNNNAWKIETDGNIITEGSFDIENSSGIKLFNSINLLTLQTGSQDGVNLGISTFTGSIREELNSIEAYTSSLKDATIVSSSTQISNYYKFAETASANTFYGDQTISGSLFISGATEFGGNLVPKSAQGATLGTEERPFSDIFVSSGSINIASDVPGDPNTSLSNEGGNILVSAGGMRLVGNASFIAETGSFQYLSGSFTHIGSTVRTGDTIIVGEQEITGSLDVMGNINVASGSGFFYEGNKLFNRGQFYHTATLSGSANTAYPFQYNTTDTSVTNGTVYVENDSRVYVKHTGIYNIQFSSQLRAVTSNPIDFSVWFSMTGSDVINSNTDYTIEKVSGGGNMVAALNYLMPLSSGSYFEIYYSKTRTDGLIEAKGVQSTPTRPATPSVILTVTQIA